VVWPLDLEIITLSAFVTRAGYSCCLLYFLSATSVLDRLKRRAVHEDSNIPSWLSKFNWFIRSGERLQLSVLCCFAVFLFPCLVGKPGVLVVVKNYTGDRLNFGMAVEKAKSGTVHTPTPTLPTLHHPISRLFVGS
jgi:hypothetical protein